ncbi:NnrU family protein [Telluria aromaticivorans]|uniref:MFS transporter n=1 Tax=Telluria aromaticivorans TaxID=2725995 RepID=A0A7Y2JX43_9BURK|nr:NnrU family protein [Telluria aromaticivorans]NNG22635.1 MFS transporter [Telluria aromaticivorans]
MDGSILLLASAAAFVGSHFILSHPLRRPLVAAMGEKGFLALYSVVAFATLGGMASVYPKAPETAPLWNVGDGLWALATVLMLAASVMLLGSLIRNPAMPGASNAASAEARGVFGITRHPMMWAFAIWGIVHILVYPVTKNIIVAVAIIVLSLVGAALQDRKKAGLDPQGWTAWEGRTSYWPFAAIAQGRARFGGFGAHALGGGLVFWLLATWAHIPMAGWAAGIWRWLV